MQAPWKTACRYCGRLAESEECADCRGRFEQAGHYPEAVGRQQAPGQPRVVIRTCGICGAALDAGDLKI